MRNNGIMNKFKKGAASFYMVAIATLVLVIIATSFAAVIIAEIARTSNDDLAQSAYDAAMAGVEDARLAFYNYSNCIDNGGVESDCKETYLGDERCNSFAVQLGRAEVENESGDIGEVKIQESSDNNMDQAYTCVKLSKSNDVKGVIDNDNPTKVMKIELGENEDASSISSIKLSWKRKSEDVELPVMEIGLVQTAESFKMDSFEKTLVTSSDEDEDRTNRGTVFLRSNFAEGVNEIGKEGFLKSNDKVAQNDPYEVKCDNNKQPYPCTVNIVLPKPIGDGTRSDKTFMITWSSILDNNPSGGSTYGVDWKMELCKGDEGCYKEILAEDGTVEAKTGETANLNMQINVDSTGRANDLYRRVEVRLDKGYNVGQERTKKIYAVSVDNIYKIEKAICEKDFGVSNCDE